MNDRELLELAAKAAGIFGEWVDNSTESSYYKMPTSGVKTVSEGRTHVWNPLTSSGDALRLAVKLNLSVDTNWYNSDACWLTDKSIVSSLDSVEEEPHNDDPYAATRRAIVRAAAEIGRRMK